MRKQILITAGVMVLMLGASACAQMKVVQRSAKKQPVWVNSAQQDYIVTSAISPNIEAAKEECLENVRKQIIRAVAENVKSSREINVSQEIDNNQIVKFLDTYTSSYSTQTANVPYLKGITISKVEDFYWEKRRDTKTKQETYLYAIKYPFPSLEVKKLVREFELRDKEMYDRYLTLDRQLATVSSIEEIDRAISDLNPLIEYFFDDVRRNAAITLQGNYKKLYDQVTFRPISNELGKYVFALNIDGRDVTTSQRVTLKSDIATKLQMVQDGTDYIVTYDYSGAAYDDENDIDVRFNIGGRYVTHKFYFTVKKYRVEINPVRTAYLTAELKSDTTINDLELRIDFESRYREFTVKNITLNIPGVVNPLFLDDLNMTLEGSNPTLNVFHMKELPIKRKLNQKMNLLTGNMDVYIPETGKNEKIYFSLTFRPNW